MKPFSSPSDDVTPLTASVTGPLAAAPTAAPGGPLTGPLTAPATGAISGLAGAPVLVLGSSLGTATAMWAPQLDALTARFRVLRVEHPGHGGAPATDEAGGGDPLLSIDALGERLLRVLDRLGIGRVSYVGLSLGAMVGMWLAAHAPDRVDRLALLCTSAYLPPATGWRDRAATVRTRGMSAIVDAVVGRWFTPPFAEAFPEVVTTHRAMLAATDPNGYAACCEAVGGMDLRDALPRIAAPTLVVAGADDPATPVAHARQIAAAVPGARLEVLADAAHLANVEQPERTTRLLLDHLGPVSP